MKSSKRDKSDLAHLSILLTKQKLIWNIRAKKEEEKNSHKHKRWKRVVYSLFTLRTIAFIAYGFCVMLSLLLFVRSYASIVCVCVLCWFELLNWNIKHELWLCTWQHVVCITQHTPHTQIVPYFQVSYSETYKWLRWLKSHTFLAVDFCFVCSSTHTQKIKIFITIIIGLLMYQLVILFTGIRPCFC